MAEVDAGVEHPAKERAQQQIGYTPDCARHLVQAAACAYCGNSCVFGYAGICPSLGEFEALRHMVTVLGRFVGTTCWMPVLIRLYVPR
jgi:hypothetical protein